MALENAPFLLVGLDNTDAPNARRLTSDPFASNLQFTDSGPEGSYTLTPVLNLRSLTQINTPGLTTYLGDNRFTSRSITSPGSILVSNATGESGNISLSVVNDTSIQQVQIQTGGTPIGAQSTLNLISGSGITVNATDSGSAINIVFSASGGGGGGGDGTVTSITAGTGLDGGTITSSGTISIADTGIEAGSYVLPTLNVNAQGQITAIMNGEGGTGTVTEVATGIGLTGGPIIESGTVSLADIESVTPGVYAQPNLIEINAQGQVIGIEAGTIGGGTVTEVATGTGLRTESGDPITVSGTIELADIESITAGVYTQPNLIEINAQGQIIGIENGTSGGGTVTEVATGIGLVGGPITTEGTISLANTDVEPGSYTSANITVNAQGQITFASNGTGAIGGVSIVNTVVFGDVGTFEYEPTTGMQFCFVQVWGGGGSGGIADDSNNATGGGGGGYAQGWYLSTDVGSSQMIVVGAGGASVIGPGGPTNNGNNGEQSQFGNKITALGGQGGQQRGSAAGGGIATGGSYQCFGGDGTSTFGVAGSEILLPRGGNSFLTNSGFGFVPISSTSPGYSGFNGEGRGAGGGPGFAGSLGLIGSGSGSPGAVIITEYIAS